MKKVILKRIKIENFRSRTIDVIFNGDTNILGKNKIGKSTILNAFLWVFTGSDQEDRSNFQLFDNKLPMTHDNAIPAVVHIWLDIDGNEFKYSRIATQSWVRKRGESEYTKGSSDNYRMFIDDIELSAGEFKKRVEEMFAPIDALKIILNVKQIYSLDWKVQRELFSSICESINPEDYKGSYGDLFNEMKKYSISELESRITTNINPIKSLIKSLPLTIQTLEQNLPDISDAENAKIRIEKNKKQIEEIDAQLQGVADSIAPLIKKRNLEISNIDALKRAFAEKSDKYYEKYQSETNKIKSDLENIILENRSIDYRNQQGKEKKESIQKEIERLEKTVADCIARREILLLKQKEVKARPFNEYKCSYCGQDLPDDKLESLKEIFLKQKNEDNEQIIKEGKENNARRAFAEKQIEDLKEQLKINFNQNKKSTEELEKRLEELDNSIISYEETEEYILAKTEIETLEKNITVIPEQDNDGLLNMKKQLMLLIEEDSKIIGLIEERKKQEQKIVEYRNQQRSAANELAEWENIDNQLKAYKQEKANLVSEKVNKLLQRVKVEMVTQNKSGEWIPSCTITTDGVQSTVYNKAEKILSGIDISNAFMRHYDLNMPLFIDDAESISNDNMIETDRQLIRLIVSNNDKIEITNYENRN